VTVVAIHQPNFFPWLGFFDKLARADVFLLMDNVQLPKKGGSWVNRVRLMMNGEAKWATMPVRRPHGVTRIADVTINNEQPWRSKLLHTIELNYAKAAHFDTVFPAVRPLVEYQNDSLVGYNTHAIRSIAELLGIRTPILSGCDVGGDGQATDLLVSMVRKVDGTAYLCGAGAAAYQKDEDFDAAGIAVIRQDFVHPVYAQRSIGPFVSGLSIIDVLMNWGVDATQAFLADEARGR
jgi:hypothetical protein